MKPILKTKSSNVTLSEHPLDERFRLAPFTLRLTENKDGVVVPNRIQLFRTGLFKKLMPNGRSIQFAITKETLEEMLDNWKNKVRGQDIAIDFAHKSDEEAAGWVTNLYLDDDGTETELWAEVDWTPDGYAAVAGKKFRYISPDFAFGWTDNETGEKYGATLFGAGLTNRPVIKNMAPTSELTEVQDMATKTVKAAEKKKTLQELEKENETLRLKLQEIEMSEDDGADDEDEDDGDEDDGGASSDSQDKKPKVKAGAKSGGEAKKEMNMEELQAAYQKVCDELNEVKKSMAKQLAETQLREKEAKFTILLAEGKVVPAQKEAFMSNDVVKFSELAQSVKFETVGDYGKSVNKTKTPAQDEVLKLAEEAVKAGRFKARHEAISTVLSENPELNVRYVKETSEDKATA